MLPNNKVYRSSTKDKFLHYDDQLYQPLIAHVRGGLDIRDAVLGLDVADWLLYYDVEDKVFLLEKEDKIIRQLGAPPYGREPLQLAFAFDEEMRFFWGYSYLDHEGRTSERRLEFNWYHPEQNLTVKMTLDDVSSINVVLDDRRKSLVDHSDILLVYVRGRDRMVCVRYQRDLFSVEYPLFVLLTGESLIRCDVTVTNKLQFEIGKLQKPITWVRLLDYEGIPVLNHKNHPIWVVENSMSEVYGGRPALSELGYKSELLGQESILIVDRSEEQLVTLATMGNYLRASLTLDNYYTKSEVNGTFARSSDLYTRSESHELFEIKGISYSRAETDSRYALKGTSYSKAECDNLFARPENVYSRDSADRTFAVKTQVYTTDQIHELFALKAEVSTPVHIDLTPYLTKNDAAYLYASVNDVYTANYIDATYVRLEGMNQYYTKAQIDDKLAAKQHVVEPQKTNLVRNGLCEYGDTTGWHPAFEYVNFLSPTSPFGAMAFSGPAKRLVLDQLIPVLFDKPYRLSYEYRYIKKMTPGIDLKIAFQCLDRDRQVITGQHFGCEYVSTTRLLAPLKPGDTYMRVEDTQGWLALDPKQVGQGNILLFNYQDAGGYEYNDPRIPYTRNIAYGEYIPFKATEFAAPDTHIDKPNKRITLAKPWAYHNPHRSDGVFPVGTRISRMKPYAGSDELEFRAMDAVGHQYDSSMTHVVAKTLEFNTRYNTSGSYKKDLLPPGTAYLRPVLYPNYNFMADKLEYGLTGSAAPEATLEDVVAISQLHLSIIL